VAIPLSKDGQVRSKRRTRFYVHGELTGERGSRGIVPRSGQGRMSGELTGVAKAPSFFPGSHPAPDHSVPSSRPGSV
jgi:hypothetical protein